MERLQEQGWILEFLQGRIIKWGYVPEDTLSLGFVGKRIKVSVEEYDMSKAYWKLTPMYLEPTEVPYIVRTDVNEYIFPSAEGIACVGQLFLKEGEDLPMWTHIELTEALKKAKLIPYA